MKILFTAVGIIMLVIGAGALAISKTMFGEIAGLVAWVIAAQLTTSAAIIDGLDRLRSSKPAE